MQVLHNDEQRFASFLLGDEQPLELAIDAQKVLEATVITGSILPLPASAEYIEGIMQLRDDTIPVVNMKKRLALTSTAYRKDAKVAVVQLLDFRCGLLFDDIKDVLQIAPECLQPLHPVLCSEDRIVSDLIKLGGEGRTLEVLDLDRILPAGIEKETGGSTDASATVAPERVRTYSRFVVFDCMGQPYGVRVEQAQEITFLSDIDDLFQKDAIEGALNLRGSTIPVLNAAHLLLRGEHPIQAGEETRILVLTSGHIRYGVIVDAVREILSVADDAILPLPAGGHPAVEGIVQRNDHNDVMLVNVETLIRTQQEELEAMAHLRDTATTERIDHRSNQTRHLITADCYLIFSLEKHYAIELNDVQEIIDVKDLMALPSTNGKTPQGLMGQQVLNLRGTVIPVINLDDYFEESCTDTDPKLIISRKADRIVALRVSRIVTIYKQVKFQETPSLNPRYRHCADMLDRLIEFTGDAGIKEHVLVINIDKLMENHLGMLPAGKPSADDTHPDP